MRDNVKERAMKLNPSQIRRPSGTSDATSVARITRMAKPPEIKYKRRQDGQLVKLRRVRRKKTPEMGSLVNLSQSKSGARAKSTSEMGMPAPVQTKSNAVWAKKGRYRSITPGTGSLIIKANPSGLKARPIEKRPLNTVDQMI